MVIGNGLQVEIRLPMRESVRFQPIGFLIVHADRVIWVPNANGGCSSKSIWHAIRSKQTTVVWHKLGWCPWNTPRWSFIQWLAFQGRLSTKDQKKWRMSPLIKQWWIHNHIFFECLFSFQVWQLLMRKYGNLGALKWLLDIISWALVHCKGKIFNCCA